MLKKLELENPIPLHSFQEYDEAKKMLNLITKELQFKKKDLGVNLERRIEELNQLERRVQMFESK